eukprot:2141152-Rhodomonas_salina.4
MLWDAVGGQRRAYGQRPPLRPKRREERLRTGASCASQHPLPVMLACGPCHADNVRSLSH